MLGIICRRLIGNHAGLFRDLLRKRSAMIRPPDPPSRRYEGKTADPSRWDAFAPCAGDVVVSTPPKSGTTWVQGILALLISGDPEVDAAVSRDAPWLDIATPDANEIMERLNAQPHRRQVKTHTPLDGIPLWPDLRYVAVYRHPIDVHLSFRRHVANMKDEVLGDVFLPNVSEGFRIFLDGEHRNGASLASIIDHYRSALALKGRPNLLRLHYADMTRDLPTAFRRIAAHVGLIPSPEVGAALIEAATFGNMKRNARRFAVAAGQGFWADDADFFDSGTSGKWVGVLSDGDLAAYDARMDELLDPQARRWLEWGNEMSRAA